MQSIIERIFCPPGLPMLKLTKTELRTQQTRLALFERYLPTLQLKKAMLQFEVYQTVLEIGRLRGVMEAAKAVAEGFAPLLFELGAPEVARYADVVHVKKHYENIAGVEIPILRTGAVSRG